MTYTLSILLTFGAVDSPAGTPMKWPPNIQVVLDNTRPLTWERGNRLPLYLWAAHAPGGLDDDAAERMVKALDERGVGLISSWDPGRREQSLADALRIARIQTRLGLRVNVNANRCLYSFFNGDERTAHIDEAGGRFWDESFGQKHKMGCPFALDFRKPAIREQLEPFAEAYKQAGVHLDFVFADWEIDGPIEFNRAHEASKKCRRCRENIEQIDDFATFQKTLREIRSRLQREVYSQPILSRFPNALVGNYAVYPHNGLRYWYDYFEYYVEGQPYLADQRAKYRKWYDEFPGTGYTFAMPVVYTWYPTFGWYDFEDPDYRWFYNLLLTASNAGRHTPADVPVISFVHWHTVSTTDEPDPAVKQFSQEKYQELLWHMLLRGIDGLFLWCRTEEAPKEIELLHPVYAAAQQYGPFLEKGVPVTFNVPKQPAPVISGLRLDNKVLIRRTEFGQFDAPIELKVGKKTLKIPPAPGQMQLLSLD